MSKALNSSIVGNIVDMNEYSIEFSIPRFTIAFLYHLAFFILGPLSLPLIILTSSKYMAMNMGFLPGGGLSGGLMFQYFTWMSHALYMIFWGMRFFDKSQHWLPGIYVE